VITNLRLARAEQSGPATSKAMAGGLMHCGIAGDCCAVRAPRR